MLQSFGPEFEKGEINFSPESIKQQFHATYESNGLGFDAKILKSINFNSSINARTSSDITEVIKSIDNHFGENFYTQITIINDIVLTNVDHLDQVNIEDFTTEVEQSSLLSEDEKVMLFAYLSSLASTIDFIENEGIKQIEVQVKEAIIAKNPNLNGRLQGCTVNVRNVLWSGIYGLATNAFRGAVIGGTVGTFTVPILGTATGILGGAVFGAAAGFVTGVVGGIVVELASSCTRLSGYEAAACAKTVAMYHPRLIKSPPSCQWDNESFTINNGPRTIESFFLSNLVRL